MMSVDDEIAVSCFRYIGMTPGQVSELIQKYPSFSIAWSKKAWTEFPTAIEYLDHSLSPSALWQVHSDLFANLSLRVLFHEDDLYPILLKETSSPPPFLFLKGNPDALQMSHSLAVVGSRKISDYGQQILHQIIPDLVRGSFGIVSGLAYGVDILAHRIALKGKGLCLAVLGSGVDVIYPSKHISVVEDIIKCGGAIVSEQPLGMNPLPQFFPARNRIISGLSRATLVIEARKRSGSLITAQYALDQNRDVFAVPGNIFSENQEGTNILISQGALPLLSSKSVFDQYNLSTKDSDNSDQTPLIIHFDTPEEERLYECLRSPHSLDELQDLSNIPFEKMSSIISLMEINGLIRKLGSFRYGRC